MEELLEYYDFLNEKMNIEEEIEEGEKLELNIKLVDDDIIVKYHNDEFPLFGYLIHYDKEMEDKNLKFLEYFIYYRNSNKDLKMMYSFNINPIINSLKKPKFKDDSGYYRIKVNILNKAGHPSRDESTASIKILDKLVVNKKNFLIFYNNYKNTIEPYNILLDKMHKKNYELISFIDNIVTFKNNKRDIIKYEWDEKNKEFIEQ